MDVSTDAIAAIPDPAERAKAAAAALADIPDLQHALGAIRREAIAELRATTDPPMTYQQLGEALDIGWWRIGKILNGDTSSSARRKRATEPEQ